MQLKRFIKSIVLIFIMVCPTWVFAQPLKNPRFIPPLKIPLLLSGNFGELRSNHLHSGLDFRTYGLPGIPVYAAEDGYISRIKIEPGGFGKAIYISHSNGYTSVYGHLSRYRNDIDSISKVHQYQENKFSTDIFFKPGELKVKKGEMIALSGNSGGSMGPHVHFEIRGASQMPLNIQRVYSFPIRDTIPPAIFNLWMYPMDSLSSVNMENTPRCFKISETDGRYVLDGDSSIHANGKISFGVETVDFMNSSSNTLGVYSIELFVNNQLEFSQVIDCISFSENRSVNSLIDYGYFVKNHTRINRLYVQPNNKLPVYKGVRNRGIILMSDSSVCQIRIRIKDANLNASELIFKVMSGGKGTTIVHPVGLDSPDRKIIHYFSNNFFRYNQDVELQIPAFSVYDDFQLHYEKESGINAYYSHIHHFKNEDIPIDKPIFLKIVPEKMPVKLQSKALLARVDESGTPEWYGGGFAGNAVMASIRAFGRYVVTVDTLAPGIFPINSAVKNSDFSNWGKIAFRVMDAQSGISFYNGKIDGQWALFEYDEKQDLIFHSFDLTRMKSQKKHTLDLMVTDKKGNKANYHTVFYK